MSISAARLALLLWLASVPTYSEPEVKHNGPFALIPDGDARYRLYSGEELIAVFETKDEVNAAALNHAKMCVKDVNTVYSETVRAVNRNCAGFGETDTGAAVGTPSRGLDAPAGDKPSDTTAADHTDMITPPETQKAPAGTPTAVPPEVPKHH